MNRSRNIDTIINEQVHSWAMGQRSTDTGTRAVRPIITVSRAFAARGAALARLLGERTGFAVWDRELVQAVAEEAGGDERVMATLDESRRKTVDDAVRSLLVGFDHTNVQYFRALVRVIRTIASHGSAIVVGRGANFVLRAGQGFRVRVDAPLTWRATAYAHREGVSDSVAKDRCRSMDATRADFVFHHYRQDIDESSAYDMVLNAATFDLEAAADLVITGYEAWVRLKVSHAAS